MLTISPSKTRLYQGFPGPLLGWAVCFYGLPLFGPDAVNILKGIEKLLIWNIVWTGDVIRLR